MGGVPPAVSTPCTKVCILDPASGFCEGCGRTGDEIAAWSRLDEPARLAVMALLPDRMRRLRASRHVFRREAVR